MTYNETNKKHWDKAARVHINAPSGYYDIEGFNNGKSSLKQIHIDELGDVKGKKILHLLCHIGLDTLSLARLGAEVVGLDISQKSIDFAEHLSKTNNINARFICSDVYDLDGLQEEEFDIIFASHGVTCWLKDLNKFMEVVSSHLKPQGLFYLMDGHPISIIMTNEPDGKDIKVAQEYFSETISPKFCDGSDDYANKAVRIEEPTYEWKYTLSDIVNSVCQTGLSLVSLNEFPFCDDNYYVGMQQDNEGWWRLKEQNKLPLMFSIKAVKKEKEIYNKSSDTSYVATSE